MRPRPGLHAARNAAGRKRRCRGDAVRHRQDFRNVRTCQGEAMTGISIALGAALLALGINALGQEARRFAPLKPEEMSDAQRKVHDAIAGGPRGGVRGPFNALLRSPELADQAQKLGEVMRFRSSLAPRLNEL